MAFLRDCFTHALGFLTRPGLYPASVKRGRKNIDAVFSLVMGATLAAAFMFVGFNLAPTQVVAPVREQMGTAPVILMLMLFELAILAPVLMLPARDFWVAARALSMTLGIITTVTTAVLVVVAAVFSILLQTHILVFPPLFVRVTDPFPLSEAPAVAAAFLALHAVLFVLFMAACARTLSEACEAPAWRGWIASAAAILLVSVFSVFTTMAGAWIGRPLAPFFSLLLPGSG